MNGDDRLLVVENLQVARGGVGVLDIPEFFIRPGEFVSLIGPNGSGKSSLLLALMCLLPRLAGRLRYRGQAIDSAAAALAYRRRIALVFQEPQLFGATVHDNVAAGLKLRGLPRREIQARTEACLEQFGLSAIAQRHARKLSGGEARRVGLARALVLEPELIFFDEPFTNLDASARQALCGELECIVRRRAIPALLVTHDPSEALRLSDRIVAMHAGRIIQSAPPAELAEQPANAFVADFVGGLHRLDCHT